jgi:hypothetical protein
VYVPSRAAGSVGGGGGGEGRRIARQNEYFQRKIKCSALYKLLNYRIEYKEIQ